MNSTMVRPHPAPQARRPAQPRHVAAQALPGGGWRIKIESATEPGTMHALTVHTNGHVGRCDCPAAGYHVACDHRRDAADLAKALGVWYAAKREIGRLEAEPRTRGTDIEIERLRGEMWFSERCIRKMFQYPPTDRLSLAARFEDNTTWAMGVRA